MSLFISATVSKLPDLPVLEQVDTDLEEHKDLKEPHTDINECSDGLWPFH